MVIVFPSGSSMIIFGENYSPRRKASSRWYGLQWLLDDELLPHEGGVKSLHLKVTIIWDMCVQFVDEYFAMKFQSRCDPRSSRRRAEGLSSFCNYPKGRFLHVYFSVANLARIVLFKRTNFCEALHIIVHRITPLVTPVGAKLVCATAYPVSHLRCFSSAKSQLTCAPTVLVVLLAVVGFARYSWVQRSVRRTRKPITKILFFIWKLYDRCKTYHLTGYQPYCSASLSITSAQSARSHGFTDAPQRRIILAAGATTHSGATPGARDSSTASKTS
jgi:hypothetical protein